MRKKPSTPCLLLRLAIFTSLLLCLAAPLSAGSPHSAFYSSETDKVLWFIHASDTHLGTSGSTDSSNLAWLVGQAKTVIDPSFIVVTGDLTDSTNGNILDFPDGPYQAEWDQYKDILNQKGVSADFYFDIPGNHDAYNDKEFEYYLANSVQGRATGRKQASWTRSLPSGEKYHFLGVNSAGDTGEGFSLLPPYGDHAGLSSGELAFISEELITNQDAQLTLLFGHHPLADTGHSSDTYMYYGRDEFVDLMNAHGASLYGYGHTHSSSQDFYSNDMPDGVFYFSVSSLGKDSPNEYTLTAIDCNGISSVTQPVRTWPVVLITAPMDRGLGGGVNKYAYTVENGAANPIRALVFAPVSVSQVQFRINGGVWQSMSQSATPNLWQGVWDASNMPAGVCTIQVQASTASATRSDKVTTYVNSPIPGPSITLTSPGGGQVWEVGTSQEITWTSNNAGDNVKIDISRNGGSTWTTLAASTPNDGSYTWTVAGTASTSCKVRVTSTSNTSIKDLSDTNFTIKAALAGSITVTSPNGGEVWEVGTNQTITWTPSNAGANVKIDISRNGGSTWTTLSASTPNDGSYPWTVAGTASSSCKVRVTSTTNTAVKDVSNAGFTIVPGTITLMSPNGGETWVKGTSQEITWTSRNAGGNVKINITRNGGSTWTALTASTPNDGSYTWLVSGTASTNCRIRVISTSSTIIKDTSDASFTIR